MSELTAADVLAMQNKDDNDFLEGNGIIILILFFLMFGGAWGGFGNNAATQGALTRAEVQDVVTTQATQNLINQGFSNVERQLCTEFANTNSNMNNGFANMALAMNNGFNGVQSAIADSRYAMQNCCCELKNAIHSEGEATRSLMQANTIQELRDKLADKDRELLATGLVTAQTVQTNNLENFMRNLVSGCGSCGCV